MNWRPMPMALRACAIWKHGESEAPQARTGIVTN
jgi:hypothetical protein